MFTLALSLLAAAAAPEPTAEQLRAAVQRALPVIEKGGTEWMRDQKCNSCHNVTFLVWSHNAALARGVAVDRKKLADWTRWSLAESLSDRYWFKLSPRALAGLQRDGVTQAIVPKLKPLEGKVYITQKGYLTALGKALGSETFARHKDRLVKAATLPNNGGGPDTLAQLLMGRGFPIEAPDSYRRVQELLLQWQEPDGSWKAQGQLPGMKWSDKEMHEATTMWAILAVSTADPMDANLARVRTRALTSLRTAQPGLTLQSLALHLLIAHRFGDAAGARQLQSDLLARQNSDGGWSWVKETKVSDAFATGQALYVLGQLPRDATDPHVKRAWAYLLKAQGKDGGWEVPQGAINVRPRKLNVFSYWGTAWAVIGVLETLPPKKR